MNQNLENIFKLESEEKYNEAYTEYKNLLSSNSIDFQAWKYYYFFLWSMIEDVDGLFTTLNTEELRGNLKNELEFGLTNFENIPEFNFIAGYTISIFPYEFGNFDDLENFGKQLLSKASKSEPSNKLFRMVFLGSLENQSDTQTAEYKNLKLRVSKEILEKHSNKGLLNEYYNQVFIRK